MELSLNPKRPLPMWFLGKPKEIKVSLTMVNPGPVEVDFSSLERGEQEKVLIGLKDGVLTSDVPFQELYKYWKETEPKKEEKEAEEKIVEQQQDVPILPKAKSQGPITVEDKLDHRADIIVERSFPAVRTALKNADIRLIRKVYQREEKKLHPRVSVLNWLMKKLRKHETEVATQLRKVQEANKKPPRKITNMFEIVEDESEVVELIIDRTQKNETIESSE